MMFVFCASIVNDSFSMLALSCVCLYAILNHVERNAKDLRHVCTLSIV
jgi:hypothetical protein